jgi:hypothetical protein
MRTLAALVSASPYSALHCAQIHDNTRVAHLLFIVGVAFAAFRSRSLERRRAGFG